MYLRQFLKARPTVLKLGVFSGGDIVTLPTISNSSSGFYSISFISYQDISPVNGSVFLETDSHIHNVTSLLMPGNIANTQSHTVSHRLSPMLKTEDSNPAGSAFSNCTLFILWPALAHLESSSRQVSSQPLSFMTPSRSWILFKVSDPLPPLC